ncbi:uncharacterized protein LOC118433718 isoform X2 [Folsomia candida]|uniref:uncharacterized protein LOC118433718 isoform X2 n=1 Tax=Folsomia candida TaxID=158441 RepID=UPI001604A5DB|nr:uncharacterized protein LOC118433718 isoform X2 [Folsomia candida]
MECGVTDGVPVAGSSSGTHRNIANSPDSKTTNGLHCIFSHISLPYGPGENGICGKLHITHQLGDSVHKIGRKSDNWPDYALIVELHGYLKKGYGQSCRTFLRELVPDEDSEFICHSKIFVLLSGEEKGIKKGANLKECQSSVLPRNSVSFKLKLPENHDQLPSSIGFWFRVEYFLVAYLRTNDGYVQVDTKPLPGYHGHNLVSIQNECETIIWTSVTKEFTLVFTSPRKYYLIGSKQGLPFNVTLTFARQVGPEISIQCWVALIEKISIGEAKPIERVLDTKTQSKHVPGLSLTFRGKFLDPENKVGCEDKWLSASFNPSGDGQLKIQHYLRFRIFFGEGCFDLGKVRGEVEIFIGTGRVVGGQGRVISRGFLSRMRSQSVSSLLSLFPPSYSRTGSRRGSVMSLETLPPH